jgi:hypothetical protein
MRCLGLELSQRDRGLESLYQAFSKADPDRPLIGNNMVPKILIRFKVLLSEQYGKFDFSDIQVALGP